MEIIAKPVSLIAVCAVLLLASVAPALLTEKCVVGTAPDVANDAAQIQAVRAMIDDACVCSAFDGSTGLTHGAYVKCAAAVIATQTQAAALRPQCKQLVKGYYVNSTCGRNPRLHTEPCVQKDLRTGQITCAIRPTTKKDGVTPSDACTDQGRSTRVACPVFTNCVDAGDTNHDGRIGKGDAGMCMITEFPLPADVNSNGDGIAVGPDGSMWFPWVSNSPASGLGKILTAQPNTITGIPFTANLPLTHYVVSVTTGPDGNLWFTDVFTNPDSTNLVGRVTPTGIEEFSLPTPHAFPTFITTGPDGNIWVSEQNANQIARISLPDLTITEFPIPTGNSSPGALTAGADGNVWFTEVTANQVARIETASPNTITEFPCGIQPAFITAGPDGNLWFTEEGSKAIAKIMPNAPNTITEFPTSNRTPFAITLGPDGDLWFTDSANAGISALGHISPLAPNTITMIPGNVEAAAIAVGSDGNLWFLDPRGLIARVIP